MQYSILSILAVLTASSLGFPRYSWGQAFHHPAHIKVCNYMGVPVYVEYFGPQPEEPRRIEDGNCEVFGHLNENGDLKFTVDEYNWQAEVSHNTGQHDYDFAIKGINDGFPGHAAGRCGEASVRYRPDGEATCPPGTPIDVDLYPDRSRRPFGVPYYYRSGWY
ncbi:hypothetical protein X797_011392 [Metarhizium robertsii]|uniref:Uncharacterized protein n=1 Tax=Metarhizium robertsii TaxID=568076 RepID=A0A014QRV3_9HYPO|nr:hypothetical protein X797_011392 [Metarhizium robertsii]